MAPPVDLRWWNLRVVAGCSPKLMGAGDGLLRWLHSSRPQGLLGNSSWSGSFLISSAIGGAGLYLSGLYFFAFGAYCLANFARCREANCIITGLGWGVLAFVAFFAAVMQLHWLYPIWNAFLVVAVLGHGFELVWAATRHTHVLRL